jgi:hypothetical protein
MFYCVVSIYDAMAVAGMALLHNVADATVDVVTHKYGEVPTHTTHRSQTVVYSPYYVHAKCPCLLMFMFMLMFMLM